MKPNKPNADFPLFAHKNGQWAKSIRQGGKPVQYYFGRWDTDPKGVAALLDWVSRKDNIRAGLDQVRVASSPEGLTLGELMLQFLTAKQSEVAAGELSPRTYGDYLYELQKFVDTLGTGGQVKALLPAHFASYAQQLVQVRKLGRHARRRVIAYVKAMFNWGAGNGKFPAVNYGTDFVGPDTSADAIRQAKARAGKVDYSKRIVTGEEIEKLQAGAQPLMRAMILMGINCGLGPADIARLRWRHLNLETGVLDMARGKTGTERRGYLWKKTRAALARVKRLKAVAAAYARGGENALVFVSRNGLAVYREVDQVKDGKVIGVQVFNPLSSTFGKIARLKKLDGVTFYRLRHSFKTLGKKSRDNDALNLMMGHKDSSTGGVYDHEAITARRIKRVAIAVKRGLWPVPKEGTQKPTMRIAAASIAQAG